MPHLSIGRVFCEISSAQASTGARKAAQEEELLRLSKASAEDKAAIEKEVSSEADVSTSVAIRAGCCTKFVEDDGIAPSRECARTGMGIFERLLLDGTFASSPTQRKEPEDVDRTKP